MLLGSGRLTGVFDQDVTDMLIALAQHIGDLGARVAHLVQSPDLPTHGRNVVDLLDIDFGVTRFGRHGSSPMVGLIDPTNILYSLVYDRFYEKANPT